jgi:hypothetical protein
MTTTDYNALDTAALVAAADALTAGITPGVIWGIYAPETDTSFIEEAPALVKALVARLRELSANG